MADTEYRTRWTDWALDQAANRFHDELRAIRNEVRLLREDGEKRREDERIERKADRKWIAGTVIAVTTLVTTTIASVIAYAV